MVFRLISFFKTGQPIIKHGVGERKYFEQIPRRETYIMTLISNVNLKCQYIWWFFKRVSVLVTERIYNLETSTRGTKWKKECLQQTYACSNGVSFSLAKQEVNIVINCRLFRHNIVRLRLLAMAQPCLVISGFVEWKPLEIADNSVLVSQVPVNMKPQMKRPIPNTIG